MLVSLLLGRASERGPPHEQYDRKTITTCYGRGSSASADGGMAIEEAAMEKTIPDMDDEALARQPRIARRPHAPTKAEVVAHMTLHAEYRDWCPHCVHGRGISHQHRTSSNENIG